MSEHIGLVPVVRVSPADADLISGGSEERRRFMDMVIVQYDHEYLDALVRYNKALNKMMVVGGFEHVNGQPRQQMAMLNPDGTLDGTFVPREIGGGAVNFAQLIDKEKVIVSGTFSTYGGVPRLGFLILEMDGTAQQKFNVPGTFNGQLYHVAETETTLGSYGLLLMGSFDRFNGQKANNVLMLEVNLEH